MIQIMPREAFDTVGGWDTRFRGWGGEDHAAMRAMDTLYTLHKTLPGQVLHIWHPQLSPDGAAKLVNWRNRMWEGQTEVGVNNMVDLDSNPTKLIEIIEIGKQLLITRGSLTTFSIANDVAKYFAIIPAMLMVTFPAIAPLNIMRLHSPDSAILSAIIFNALIIVALIPLALRGVKFQPVGALAILQRNLLIYGLGGVIIPFIGIKAIDVLITSLKLI